LPALSQNREIGDYKEQEFVAVTFKLPQTPALMSLFAFTIDNVLLSLTIVVLPHFP
jgi:hypothetical protein